MAAFTRKQYSGAARNTTTTTLLTNVGTTVDIAATTGWPSIAGIPFYVVIRPSSIYEEKCLATISGSTLTLTRAQDDTTASEHPIGSVIYPVFTANDADEANELVSKLTTKGDLLTTDGTNLLRLGVGPNGYFLKASTSASAGVEWASIPTINSLNDIGDVTITSVEGGDFLTYNSSASAWVNETIHFITVSDTEPTDEVEVGDLWYNSSELELYTYYSGSWIQLTLTPEFPKVEELDNVYISTANTGDVLAFDGLDWYNDTVSNLLGSHIFALSGDISGSVMFDSSASVNISTALNAELDNLSDVIITSPEEFQTLEYNGTNWVNTYSSLVSYVRNVEATTLTTGTVVYLFGGTGDHASVKRADNTAEETSSKTVGLVGAPIAASQNGPVVTRGYVDGINLSAYQRGDVLWLGTNGQFTTTKAVAPNHLVYIGVVVRASNNGIVYVATQNGYEINELHDVKVTDVANKDVLTWDSASAAWVNSSSVSFQDVSASTFTGNLVPSAHNTYTLGTPSIRWADIYLGPGTLNITDNVLGTNAGLTVSNGVLQINGANQLQVGQLKFVNNNIESTSASVNIEIGELASSADIIMNRDVVLGAGKSLTFPDATVQTTAYTGDVALGTNTNGIYVADLVAGTGVTISNGASESASPTIAIGQAVGTSASVTFGRIETSGDVVVGGNLTVNGTTTTLNTETLLVEDNIVVLNSGITGSPTLNSGIEVERGTSANVVMRWNESADRWDFTNDGTTYNNVLLLSDIGQDSLNDTVITSPLNHQSLTYNGTNWINEYAPTATYARNAEANALSVGEVVYLFGATGDRASVKRASNTSNTTSSKTVGVVSVGGAAGADVTITTVGYVNGLNLGGYTAGDILYLGSTAGTVTTTKPTAPAHTVFVGVVARANAGNGIMYVKCQNGYELGELHDVKISGVSDGQFLRYNSASVVWVNDTINLGTDTAGDYVQNLTAGTGVTLSNNSGEGATPTIAIGQAVATSSSVTFANVSISGRIDKTTIRESVADTSVSASVVTADYATGDIFYVDTAPGSNFTVNLTNAPTDNGKAITVVIFVTQGATGYIPNAVQVAGSAQTIKWANGAAPTPTSSAGKIDIFSFTFVRRSSAWTVFGSSNLGY